MKHMSFLTQFMIHPVRKPKAPLPQQGEMTESEFHFWHLLLPYRLKDVSSNFNKHPLRLLKPNKCWIGRILTSMISMKDTL